MNMDRRDFVRQSTAFAAASAFLPACAKDNSGKGNANMKVKVTKDKVLVVYFSRSGNTRHAAETLALAINLALQPALSVEEIQGLTV